jgi:hypothetical protein
MNKVLEKLKKFEHCLRGQSFTCAIEEGIFNQDLLLKKEIHDHGRGKGGKFKQYKKQKTNPRKVGATVITSLKLANKPESGKSSKKPSARGK